MNIGEFRWFMLSPLWWPSTPDAAALWQSRDLAPVMLTFLS